MKVKFIPQNIEVEGNPNKTLLQIATENQLEIRSICKGVPSCAECRVVIAEGDSNILPPNKAELNLIGTNYFIDGRRLSCQVRCFGDVTVDLTEQVERQENQTKKIRGFRSNKQVESHAVNDTMLLNEKIEVGSGTDSDESQDQAHGQQGDTRSDRQQGDSQGAKGGSQSRHQGGGGHQQGKGGGQGRQQNQQNRGGNQGRGGGQQQQAKGSGGGSNQQKGSGGQPNQQRNKQQNQQSRPKGGGAGQQQKPQQSQGKSGGNSNSGGRQNP